MELGKSTARAGEKGIFVISVDFEFAWGYIDQELDKKAERNIRQELAVFPRLISLLEKYNMPATWAIVGHLLEKNCQWENGLPHPEYSRPIMKEEKKDWFFNHPKPGEPASPLWYDTENLVRIISKSKAGHEIASHSYAHLIFDEKTTKGSAIKTDLANCRRIHQENNLPFKTFVFPRNQEGYHSLLKEQGIICYRGASEKWYGNFHAPIKRIFNLASYYFPGSNNSLPHFHQSGLINIPDSLLFIGRNGLRKLVSPGAVYRKAAKGLGKASRAKNIFHFWFHPSNFIDQTEIQLEIFEKILARADYLRQERKLEILTMGQVANRWLEKHSNG
jgi:hypothetical protein